jgi:hypothetical protein
MAPLHTCAQTPTSTPACAHPPLQSVDSAPLCALVSPSDSLLYTRAALSQRTCSPVARVNPTAVNPSFRGPLTEKFPGAHLCAALHQIDAVLLTRQRFKVGGKGGSPSRIHQDTNRKWLPLSPSSPACAPPRPSWAPRPRRVCPPSPARPLGPRVRVSSGPLPPGGEGRRLLEPSDQ